MEVEKLIEVLRKFHENKPDAEIDSVEVYEHVNRHMARVNWFTFDDGGHMDFYA